MVDGLCVLANWRYGHTIGICDASFSSTAKKILRNHLKVACMRILPVSPIFARRLRNIAKSDIRFIILSVPLSAWKNSSTIERVITKFDMGVFFENLSKMFKFHQNLTRITGTLHEDLCTFMIVSRWIYRIMRNISDKVVGKIKT